MYQGLYLGHCSPRERTVHEDKFIDGVLTVTGCFERMNITREEQQQDSFKHQPLEEYGYRDMYDTYLFFKRRYEFKEQLEQ